MKERISTNFFILLLLAVLYLAALVVWPYIGFIIIAIVLAYILHPIHRWVLSWSKHSHLSAFIMVFFVAVALLLPSVFLLQALVQQGSQTLSHVNAGSLDSVNTFFADKLHINLDASLTVELVSEKVQEFLFEQSWSFIGEVADVLIGIVIMFFVLFFLFKDGTKLYDGLMDVLPLQESRKQILFQEIQLVTNAVIYGQLLMAIVQGVLGGIGFAIFGIPNPAFWGFVMGLFSFIPVLGTPLIFVPAGLMKLFAHDYFAGVGILIYGGLLYMNVDNILKPLIISEKARLNAAIILIGVIGGLKAFGFIGFIIGPLALALLITLLQMFRQDFKPSEALKEAKKKPNDELVIHLYERPPDEHRITKE